MSRICKAYEARFRGLLARVGARQVEKGILWLRRRGRDLSVHRHIPLNRAVMEVCNRVAAKPGLAERNGRAVPERFFCDAGLGGLARWLRGAGYDAFWEADIHDNRLLVRAREANATILTTDSMLMERRLLRDGVIPAFWVPPAFGSIEQLKLVFQEFGLQVGKSRCMECGGELKSADKEQFRHRIPPRTYRWLQEFFICTRCEKLYWHGSHWARIRRELDQVEAGQQAA